jgi:putative two-component system response regulator
MENRGTILIVDDEPPIRRLLNHRLSKEGYTCMAAGNAVEAAGILRDNTVMLVILDVRMPGKSGAAFLPEILAEYPDTAVIMATANDDAPTVIQCMKQGAYDYLIKPFNAEEVILSVNRALENRRLKIENKDYQLNLEKKVKEQTVKIRESFLNSLKALVRALEAKDEYTSNHSRRVAEISASLARELGMSPEYTEKIMVAGLIHDIGKIGIKEGILNKPGHLSDEEYKEVKTHPSIAAEILMTVVDDTQIIEAIVHHHERYDGTGYPDGLKGEKIPIGARILAVADAYDAMTSARPYREAMLTEKGQRGDISQ